MKTVLFWVLFGAVIGIAIAEVIENTPCNTGRDSNISSESNEISVDPCPGAADGEPCVLYTNSNATITIKFTPSVAPTQRLKSTIAWVKDGDDLTFRGMKPNACEYMSCPLTVGQQNTFSAMLTLGSGLPSGTYPLKVKIQEYRGRNKRVFACQLFTIKLTDPNESD